MTDHEKNRLRSAGEVAALPHQKSVFLGVVACPNAVGQYLHPYIVVAVFQELRALRKALVALKILKNLLPLVLAPAVVQQICFYEMRIQKWR